MPSEPLTEAQVRAWLESGAAYRERTLARDWLRLHAENEWLRKAIEDAPHGITCNGKWYPSTHPCDCWKSRVLGGAQ